MNRLWTWAAVIAAVLICAVVIYRWNENRIMRAELLAADPADIPARPDLIAFATGVAKPIYAEHCVACHGADMKGNQAKGAPNLADNIWIHGYGNVLDIEQIVLYGIRAGLGKSWNVTDMPAEGRSQQLYPYEIRDVEAYILSFTRPVTDPDAVTRGAAIFQNKGVCYDCHSAGADGVPDYGAPSFRDTDWMFGSDPEAIYQSIYSGRHGVCPSWFATLGSYGARALAVYLYSVSHAPDQAQSQPNKNAASGTPHAPAHVSSPNSKAS